MALRQWLRRRLGRGRGDEGPPSRVLLEQLWNGEPEWLHALGEYDASTYPAELAAQLARRQEVTDELLQMDVTAADARIAAIPRLRELLRIYPHPLVYEALILGYADAGRYDEAAGVAFAARERRRACARSEFPEIRGEIEYLAEWTDAEIERLRRHRPSPRVTRD